MANSTDIKTVLGGLQNQNPDYFSQFKTMLLSVGLGLTALSQTNAGTAVKAFANGNPIENILKWSDLKPLLITVQNALGTAGGTVTTLNSLLQALPTGDGEVYSDQAKPIFYEIAAILLALGQ